MADHQAMKACHNARRIYFENIKTLPEKFYPFAKRIGD
jgi:hypothetical protein